MVVFKTVSQRAAMSSSVCEAVNAGLIRGAKELTWPSQVASWYRDNVDLCVLTTACNYINDGHSFTHNRADLIERGRMSHTFKRFVCR